MLLGFTEDQVHCDISVCHHCEHADNKKGGYSQKVKNKRYKGKGLTLSLKEILLDLLSYGIIYGKEKINESHKVE